MEAACERAPPPRRHDVGNSDPDWFKARCVRPRMKIWLAWVIVVVFAIVGCSGLLLTEAYMM